LVATCTRLRPDEAALADPVHASTAALGAVACRIDQLDEEIGLADQRLAKLVGRAAPRAAEAARDRVDHAGQLLTTAGDNPERLHGEAAFATCGGPPRSQPAPARPTASAAPGGDRDANRALQLAVVVRMRWCPPTHAHAERRTNQGRSKPKIMGCVKRYLAREVYHALVADFQALNLT
jgi:transposase